MKNTHVKPMSTSKPRTKRLSVIEHDTPSLSKLYEDCYSGAASPRKAIKAMCLECVGYERSAVAECTATACPLWMYRPYGDKEVPCNQCDF